MHQVRAMEALSRGENLVLKSGTGSGKTEAWFLRAALDGVSALAVYPTLALANDQLNRLREYGSALGFKVMALDAVRRDELVKSIGYRGLRREIAESRIVITNSAFLLNELKKMDAGKASLLRPFLEKAEARNAYLAHLVVGELRGTRS
jgi:DEAD/DEAH box helicase domain-containing protein